MRMLVGAEPSPSRWVPSPGLSLTCASVSVSSVGRAEYDASITLLTRTGFRHRHTSYTILCSYDRSLADNRYSYSSHQLYVQYTRLQASAASGGAPPLVGLPR